MKLETVGIHFLSDVLSLLSFKNLLPWQRDVTTSPLYYFGIQQGQLHDDVILLKLPESLTLLFSCAN